MNLDDVPTPDVVEALDYETILADLTADYAARWPQFSAWVESEPALKILEVAAYRELLLRARVNDAARACMLPVAEGADLDNLAALFGVARRAGEADAALRRRTTLSLGAHNTAGSAAGYEFWALQTPGVHHACVKRTGAGHVRVTGVGRVEGEGAAALDAQLDRATVAALRARLSGDTVRPIGDVLNVRGVRIQAYRVNAVVHTQATVADRAAVRAAAESSVRAFCLAKHRCPAPDGSAVRRDALFAALHVPGVERVELTAPAADVAVSGTEALWPTAAVADGAEYGGGETPPEPVVRHPMTGVTVALA